MEKIINGNAFSRVIEMQKDLLSELMIIEGLPEYPLANINKKENQELLKKFTYRTCEELGEAYEQLEIALHSISTNNPKAAKECIISYNIEISDALHFLMDLFIYSGLENDACGSILEELLLGDSLEGLIVLNESREMDIWGTLFKLGLFENNKYGHNSNKMNQFTIFPRIELGLNNYGASKLGPETLMKHSLFLWEISYQLFRAMNLLKNREWSQTERSVNTLQYYERLVRTLGIFFQYVQFSGFTQTALFESYQYKSEIIKERIRNKY